MTQYEGMFPGFSKFQLHENPAHAAPGWVLLAQYQMSERGTAPEFRLDGHTPGSWNGWFQAGTLGASMPVFLFGQPKENTVSELTEARDAARREGDKLRQDVKELKKKVEGLEHICKNTSTHADGLREERDQLKARIVSGEAHTTAVEKQLKKARAHLGERAWSELFPEKA